MAITKRQKELDLIKWEKSQELGFDACGTFDYCASCNKSLENPCDKAYKKFNKKTETAKAPKAAAKPRKTTAKKSTSEKTTAKK